MVQRGSGKPLRLVQDPGASWFPLLMVIDGLAAEREVVVH